MGGLQEITTLSWILLLAAAFGAGVLNALAGGGTFITFPSLLMTGLDPIAANGTSTVVLVPGAAASAWVYRDASPIRGKLLGAILAVCVVGSLIGSELLLLTPSQRFAHIAPYLILAAALVYSFAKPLARWSARHSDGSMKTGWLLATQFLISIYGGYFGAGMGVGMIVVFQLAAHLNVQESAGLRMLCGVAINGLASANFILRGIVHWRIAIPMLVLAIAGGYLGAHAVQRLSAEVARRTVLTYAWGAGLYLLWRAS